MLIQIRMLLHDQVTGSTLFVEEAYKIIQKMAKQGLPSDQWLTSLQISHISGTEVVVDVKNQIRQTKANSVDPYEMPKPPVKTVFIYI